MGKTLGDLTTSDPIYKGGVFRMSIRFDAKVEISGESMGRVSDYAGDLFRRILILNGLDDYAWPPDEMRVLPLPGMKGAIFSFATRADKRKTVIIQ
jgi:hypothetical protein